MSMSNKFNVAFGEYESKGLNTVTDSEFDNLVNQSRELLEYFDYQPDAIEEVIQEWSEQKAPLIGLLKNHPNYVDGKFMIAFDADYNRPMDYNVVENVMWFFRNNVPKPNPTSVNFPYAPSEIEDVKENLRVLYQNMDRVRDYGYILHDQFGRGQEEVRNEYMRWDRMAADYYNSYVYADGKYYDKNEWAAYKDAYGICNHYYNYPKDVKQYLTSEDAEFFNNRCVDIRAREGQKFTKVFQKFAKIVGLDKVNDWGKQYARLGDAVNPLAIKRHTIISVNPIDYFTMSFGDNWKSCHTIDKENKRGKEGMYGDGCYSAGTVAYMLDGVTLVYYTVDESYDGTDYEKQDKSNRNLFHLGEDKLIQGRVYPQGTDGATEAYTEIRQIVQKVIADCFNVPNFWHLERGTRACDDVTVSHGQNYKDYLNYSDCNVSYLNVEGEERNTKYIEIGRPNICVCCGTKYTNYESAIECRECFENEVECAHCGYTYNRDDMHEINGEYYCEDCSFYCAYHEEWEENDDTIYVENYGRVCQDAIEQGDFHRCEHCNEWHYYDEMVSTSDGEHWFCDETCAERENYFFANDDDLHEIDELYTCDECGEFVLCEDAIVSSDGELFFCCEECAHNYGFINFNDKWVMEDELHECPHCGQVVDDDVWNEELQCCEDCEEAIREELANAEANESVDTESEAV